MGLHICFFKMLTATNQVSLLNVLMESGTFEEPIKALHAAKSRRWFHIEMLNH